jgi:Mn2+/Fe2+ NRAMP family transporter
LGIALAWVVVITVELAIATLLVLAVYVEVREADTVVVAFTVVTVIFFDNIVVVAPSSPNATISEANAKNLL